MTTDGAGLLEEPFPAHLPERLVAEAQALAETAVALYLADLDGHCLWRLGGWSDFPDTIAVRAVGPEIPLQGVAALREVVASKLPRGSVTPLVVRDRAIGVLVTAEPPAAPLDAFAAQAGLALELASGYTDVVHAARRRKPLNAAAEIQQDSLPPRIASFDRAAVAGGVLPAYDVGGDFFDYAGNADGLWLTVVDAMGRSTSAAALASVALGSLRSVRRRDGTIEEAAAAMHESLLDIAGGDGFVTAFLGDWRSATGTLAWISCGHPAPLLVDGGGEARELPGDRTYPLGVGAAAREFPRGEQPLLPGTRLVIYSDGVSERRHDDGSLLGLDGIRSALRSLGDCSVEGTVLGLQQAVVAASHRPLRDDATLLVLAPRE